MAKTVVVGCRIPTGLVLQIRDAADQRIVKAQVALQGSAVDNIAPFVREDGVGLTVVDEELWAAWEKWAMENQYPPYMKGMIFASASDRSTRAEAKEKANERTGLEGLGGSNDPRLAEFKKAGLEVVSSN